MLKLYLNTSSSVFEVNKEEYKDSQIVIFNQNGLNKINYKNELNGSQNILTDFAKISKNSSKILIAGAFSDNYGVKRKSCVVAEKGKLLGITDMCLSIEGNSFSIGGNHKVFQTSICKIGIVVDDDILDFDGIKAMSLCDADIIFSVVFSDEKPQYNYLIRAYSYLFGLPIVMITNNSVIASDANGEILSGGKLPKLNAVIPIKKNYKLITSKKRGF